MVSDLGCTMLMVYIRADLLHCNMEIVAMRDEFIS